jgi:hypothetical protein
VDADKEYQRMASIRIREAGKAFGGFEVLHRLPAPQIGRPV